MDIFGRKKRTRQPTDPAEKSIPYERTSSGRNPVHIDTISAPTNYAREFEREREREMQHRMHITAPLSNPNLASGSARYLGPDDPTRLSRTISPSSPDDFGMYNQSSPTSTIAHRRNLSNASSGGTSTRYATAHAVTSSPGNTQYLTQSSAGSQGRSSHYTSSVAGSQYGHAPSGSISRTSIASSSPFNTEHHHVHRPASPPPSQERNFARGDFEYRRPSDADVERLFFELMHKRDFFSDGGNMSDQYKEEARKNMLNFPVDKKWQLVYNDKLTEFHAERESKRQQVNTATPGRSHGAGAGGNRQGAGGTALNRNSPEWFIKKFLDGTVTTKHIESLIVMLRTCPLGWIQTFVAAKGTAVLASFLGSLHAKNPKSEVDVALEHEVLRAFRALFNSKPGANDALGQPKCVSGIAQSMVSTHLNTRKQAADILLFLCHWDKPTGHRLVLRGFDDLKSATGDHGRFDAWFRILEQTLDGRGKMGSMVGASDEIKKLSMSSSFSGFNGSNSDRVAAGNALESSLNEYAINNMFLVNAILNPDIVTEFEVRVHLRNQMDASGLQRILIKMRAFKNSHLDDQIINFEKGAELDHEDVVETFNRDVLTDMSDPVDVFKAVMEKVQGSRAYDFFLSGMQHLLLIRQEGDNLAHYYQLIDSLITAVVMDRKGAVESNDISSLLGVSVNSVLSRFADQDQIQATQQELQRTKVKAAAEEARRAELEEELKKGGEGLVGQLREKVEKLEEDLDVSRGNQDATLRDMEELERGYVDRITGMEVQIRELYDMLRESSGPEGLVMQSSESLGRKDLVATLEKQLERNRTIKKLEANARKRVAPTAANGMPSTLVKEEEEDEVEDETISADDTSRAIAETSGSTEEESEEAEMDDQAREAAKWKIQAALAAGMANRTDLQSRMTEAREARQTRRRKSNRNDSGTSDVGTLPASPHSTSARSTKVLSSSGAGGITAEPEALERYSSPPPRPPSRSLSTLSSHSGRASKAQDLPPMPEPQQVMEQVQRHSQAPAQVQERQEPPSAPSFLDEIRKRSVDVDTSTQEDVYPAPPIPPPPPPPPSVSHVIPDQSAPPAPPAPPPPPPPPMVSATGVAVAPTFIAPPMPPPPPPPPPVPPGAMMRDVHTSTVPPVPNSATRNFSPKSAAAMASASAAAAAIANPELRRDSMLNVRTSYAGDLGPAGPVTAPPPPPVPAYLAQQLVNRREVLEMARSRTKQLQWDKISAQHAAETVWARSAEDEEKLTRMLRSEGLFDEMEEDFKAKQAARRATTGAGAKKDKLELKTHLSLQTRQGIEMVLRRVKSSLVAGAKHATPEEVAHHIVNCNEAVLDQSFLTELLRHYPESETKGQLGEYRNASDEELRLLHPADRLVVLLMTVPHLKEKVKGLLYMTKYRETYDLIKEGSTRIREGAEGIQDAENFARLLQLILMMGNYLNATGVQGGAFGFKVSSVNKLVDTKAADGTTLLHFVERTISKCFPEVEGFMQELEKPSEACRVQLLDLKRDLAELKSGSMQHKKELDRFLDEDSSRTSDPYAKLMLPFLNEASSELSRLSDQVQLTERVYLDALRYFGEGPDPKRRGFPTAPPLRTEDFFGIFKEFGAAYRKVKSDNVRIGEQRAMEAKRRAAAEEKEKERLEAMARKEAGVDDSAVLETLLGSLRSGGTTPKQKRKARERRSAAKDGTGLNSASPASLLTGSAVPSDANPSDMAQAMLAKLQGGVPGGGAPSVSAAPPRTTRRRERRTTAERERDRESTNTVTTNASRASGSVRGEWEPDLLREEAEGPVSGDGEDVQHDSADSTADALVAAALGGGVASAVSGEDGNGPDAVKRSEQAELEEEGEFFEQDDFHEADEGTGARGDHPQDDFDTPDVHAQNGIVSLDRPSPARPQHLAADSSNPADGLDWFDPDRSGFSVSSGGAAQ